MADLESELENITKLKPKKSEQPGGSARGAYLQRLMDHIADLPEADWDTLSADAQRWYNDGAKAIKAQEPIPDFAEPAEEDEAGEEEEPEPADDNGEDEGEEEDEEMANVATEGETTTRKKKKAGAKKAAAPKKKAAAKSKGNGEAKAKRGPVVLKPDAVKVRIKKAILKDPTISLEDLVAQLSKGGTKISKITTAGVRSEFRHSLRVLVQEGFLKIEL